MNYKQKLFADLQSNEAEIRFKLTFILNLIEQRKSMDWYSLKQFSFPPLFQHSKIDKEIFIESSILNMYLINKEMPE